jgi:tetratricopeptide (TPR) repeat protein
MKFRSAAPFWTLALAAAIAAPSPVAEPAEITAKVAALSHDSYAVRERATLELWKLGDAALEELRATAAGKDPEAALRARELVRKIELGILPDSSPRIVELVLRYDRGALDEKRDAVLQLRRERAWRQILKLYALEKDAETLGVIGEIVRGVAVDAARECIAAEPPDIQGAFSYLSMSRPELPELMAAAALHRAAGTLERELEKAAQPQDEGGHLWRHALLAAAGRIAEAADEAVLAGEDEAAARLRLMGGDPLPWLKSASPGGQVIPPMGLATYREFVLRTWEGKPVPPELIRTLRNLARGGDEDEQAKGVRLLFLAGEHEQGEKLLEELDPVAAFYYYEASERVEDALRVVGLDLAKPDFKSWMLKRFRAIADDEGDGTDLKELAMVGYFLEHRGLERELEESFTKPLIELARADQEIFANTAGRLFTGSAVRLSIYNVRPVIDATAAYGGDDEDRWRLMVESLFSFLESPDGLWRQLGELDPDLGLKERLEWMCRLFGFLPDTGDHVRRYLDLAWKQVQQAEGVDRNGRLEFLAGINEILEDPETVLRCAEAVQLDENPLIIREKAFALARLQRWKEAAELWDKAVAAAPGNVVDRLQASVCHRRAGDAEAADRHERRAEMLAMGESRVQVDGGDVFALAGDFERATRWWGRAGAECTRESAFAEIVGRLSDDAEAREDWRAMAAYAEVQAYMHAMAGSNGFRIPSTFAMSSSLQLRIDVGMARSLALMEKDRDAAVEGIEKWAALPYADLALADHFFAPLRAAGLAPLHDRLFEASWKRVAARVGQYPDCDNSRNSAAWLASRANRRLDEAERFLEVALKNSPRQAAYLDTMAEVHFARRNREKAVEFSTRAIAEQGTDLQLIRQHLRFEAGDFPPP